MSPRQDGAFVLKASEKEAFVRYVMSASKPCARDGLPWRYIDDAYGVYISEVMLQQTQVSRVMDYWTSWMAAFPTIDALSSAHTADVLEHWQGLGYNRRALNLKKTADICASDWQGRLPRDYEDLLSLPGIGPATAAGIVSFAYQLPAVYLETNVRTVFIDYFYPDAESVKDAWLIPLVEQTCSTDDPREWYYALLDLGAWLKKHKTNPSRRSSSYVRQSKFEGSHRQKRSFLVKHVLAGPISKPQLHRLLDDHERKASRPPLDDESFDALVSELTGEGFFTCDEGMLSAT